MKKSPAYRYEMSGELFVALIVSFVILIFLIELVVMN